jgi:hypothetical protein
VLDGHSGTPLTRALLEARAVIGKILRLTDSAGAGRYRQVIWDEREVSTPKVHFPSGQSSIT